MSGLLEAILHAFGIPRRWCRLALWMRVPITDKVKPFLKELLNFDVLLSQIRSEPSPPALVGSVRTSDSNHSDFTALELSEHLPADLGLDPALLAVCREVLDNS